MSKRLKVYRTTAGFYETVVAAANQSEALKAWEVRQNLFAEGEAALAEDPDAVEAALAHPRQALRRPIGSKEAFKLEPDAPAVPKGGRTQPKAAADRRKLDEAEAAVGALEEHHAAEALVFDRREAELQSDRQAAEKHWKAEKTRLEQALKRERLAYAKAGGR